MQCRVCLEYDGDDFIQPCLCTGSVQWIHRKCLDKWRVSGSNVRAFTHCPQCGFAYLMSLVRAPTEHEQDIRRRRRRLIRHSVRNFVLLACGIQIVLCLLGMLIRAVDQKELLVTFFHLPWNIDHPSESTPGKNGFLYALRHHKSTYYLAACLLSSFSVGVVTTLVACLKGCCGHCPNSARCPLANCHCSNDPVLNYLACRDCAQCCGDCCEFCGRCDCPDCPSISGRACGSAFRGGGDAGGESVAQCCVTILLVVIVVFIFVGFMMAMATCIAWLHKVVQRYYQLRELRVLTGEYIVQDLSKLPIFSSMMTARSSVLQASAPPQQGAMDGEDNLSNSIQDASAPSAPPASLASLDLMANSTVQQSLTMDLQAIYGYQLDV